MFRPPLLKKLMHDFGTECRCVHNLANPPPPMQRKDDKSPLGRCIVNPTGIVRYKDSFSANLLYDFWRRSLVN